MWGMCVHCTSDHVIIIDCYDTHTHTRAHAVLRDLSRVFNTELYLFSTAYIMVPRCWYCLYSSMQHSAAGSMNVIDQVAPVKTIPSRSKSPTHSGGFFDRCVTLLFSVQVYWYCCRSDSYPSHYDSGSRWVLNYKQLVDNHIQSCFDLLK